MLFSYLSYIFLLFCCHQTEHQTGSVGTFFSLMSVRHFDRKERRIRCQFLPGMKINMSNLLQSGNVQFALIDVHAEKMDKLNLKSEEFAMLLAIAIFSPG